MLANFVSARSEAAEAAVASDLKIVKSWPT